MHCSERFGQSRHQKPLVLYILQNLGRLKRGKKKKKSDLPGTLYHLAPLVMPSSKYSLGNDSRQGYPSYISGFSCTQTPHTSDTRARRGAGRPFTDSHPLTCTRLSTAPPSCYLRVGQRHLAKDFVIRRLAVQTLPFPLVIVGVVDHQGTWTSHRAKSLWNNSQTLDLVCV